ncbi:MAG TPA: hypothetical protein PLA44_04145 [Propionibacteriaceae bacterium]|nr:hypothetical protein [Propionibacteriaceae bacterium]
MTALPFDENDLMAELEQAIADLNSLATSFQMPEGDVTETDRRGVASATVTPDLAVSALSVVPTWENKIPAEELAMAIDEALGRATTRAMGIDPDADPEAAAADEPPADAPTPVTAADRAEARQTLHDVEERMLNQAAAMGRDERAAEDHIDRMVAQMESALSAAERAQAEGTLPDEPNRFYSANKMVSMASTGMSFMGTEINLNWLRGKSGTAVTQCLAEILEQAPQDQAAGFAKAFRTAFGGA